MKKSQKIQRKESPEELALMARYRRTMGRETNPAFKRLLDKIVALRNAGMSSNAVAQSLEIDRGIIHNHTAKLPAVVQSKEALQLILAAKSVGMDLSSFILFMFSEFGVDYAQKNGDREIFGEMLQVAVGDD